jgi:hypothetical protein
VWLVYTLTDFGLLEKMQEISLPCGQKSRILQTRFKIFIQVVARIVNNGSGATLY